MYKMYVHTELRKKISLVLRVYKSYNNSVPMSQIELYEFYTILLIEN